MEFIHEVRWHFVLGTAMHVQTRAFASEIDAKRFEAELAGHYAAIGFPFPASNVTCIKLKLGTTVRRTI